MDGQGRAAFERVEAELNNLQAYGCCGVWSGEDDGCSYVWSRFFGPLILFYQYVAEDGLLDAGTDGDEAVFRAERALGRGIAG